MDLVSITAEERHGYLSLSLIMRVCFHPNLLNLKSNFRAILDFTEKIPREF